MLASQSVHDATSDAVEYLPAPHSVHVLAPALVPVFVTEPAAQSVHDATFEAVEYLPATHRVQFVAPGDTAVSVIEPAAHSEQYDLPPSDWYWPALQSVQDATFELVECLPAPHGVQFVAPAFGPVAVIEPG